MGLALDPALALNLNLNLNLTGIGPYPGISSHTSGPRLSQGYPLASTFHCPAGCPAGYPEPRPDYLYPGADPGLHFGSIPLDHPVLSSVAQKPPTTSSLQVVCSSWTAAILSLPLRQRAVFSSQGPGWNYRPPLRPSDLGPHGPFDSFLLPLPCLVSRSRPTTAATVHHFAPALRRIFCSSPTPPAVTTSSSACRTTENSGTRSP